MDDLPAEMVIIGGGYIGSETAHIAHALGCQVTLVITEDVPLEKFDHDLANLLRQADEDRGITYHINSKATEVRKEGNRFAVVVEDPTGATSILTTERVIHCAGRVPNVAELQLDRVGIQVDDKHRILVDEHLRTNLRHVYAVGDCAASGLPLTPVGTYAASVLNNHLFGDGSRELEYYPIPTVAFCLPGMASVGMTAAEAEASERTVTTHYKVATDWFHPRHLNAAVFAFKLFVDEERGLLLGAHLLGPGATELINLLTLMIKEEIPVGNIAETIFAYPTNASNVASMLKA